MKAKPWVFYQCKQKVRLKFCFICRSIDIWIKIWCGLNWRLLVAGRHFKPHATTSRANDKPPKTTWPPHIRCFAFLGWLASYLLAGLFVEYALHNNHFLNKIGIYIYVNCLICTIVWTVETPARFLCSQLMVIISRENNNAYTYG
jgi:hypothetical protein